MKTGGSPPWGRRARLLAAVAAAVAAAAFLNTLPAQFTFDDSFAVLYNGDVTDHSKPLHALLRNDFWGQDIRSPMSHKSYRPLTTLSFRLQHWASTRLMPAVRGRPQRGEWEDGAQRGGDSTLNPLPFHLSNVAAHAGVTALVFALSRRLALSRSAASSSPPPAARTGSGSSTSSGSTAAADAVEGSAGWAADVEAFVAALLFGLHPVHCEAVAGIVGHAELLCAGLSIPALLCYMAAADGRAGRGAAHWRAVGAAVLLGWAATLAKEIGITIMGAMLCYDALVVPLNASQVAAPMPADEPPPVHQRGQAKQGRRQQPEQQRGLPRQQRNARALSSRERPAGKAALPAASAVAAAATALLQQAAAACAPRGALCSSGSSGSKGQAVLSRSELRLKLLRAAAALAAVLLYVKARSWLAGDQLVRIYRKVENPIAFSQSPLERKLTTGYLHARYAWLLLAPLQLSADWSYACIEYVSTLSDRRNLGTVALYLALLWLGLAARPWEVLLEWAGRAPAAPASGALHERRWRLAVAAGLLVGPFFPASNVLFYVGTFIGERLLYFPSVGYCHLLAEPLAAALHPLLSPWPASKAASCSGGAGSPPGLDSGKPSRLRRAGAVLAATLLAGLLLFYAGRTLLRNQDWRDEERLFLSAQKVCWRSGKVQLNSGIVERRHQNWGKAEMHFRLAKQVDPGFCEPDYHIGITLLSKNLTAAIEQLELGVRCKYTAADSVKALNRIYMSLLERNPGHAADVLERWATVLAFPELQRYTEAATYYETAAAKAGSPLAAVMAFNRAQAALAQADPVPVGRTPDYPVRVPASRQQLEVLGRCMAGRRPVVLAVLGAGGRPATQGVKQAAYRYLAEHGDKCRGPVPIPDEPEPEDRAARTTSYHAALLHTLQEADPNDPWLQQEWGLMLAATGRHQEALVHLEVAGHIFAGQLAAGAGSSAAGSAPSTGGAQGSVLSAEGTGPISQPAAAAAAVAAYRHAQAVVAALSTGNEGQVDPAARQRMLCHLQQAECAVLQRGASASAAADALGCWAQARALGCAAPASGTGGASSTGPADFAAGQQEGDDAETDEL